MMTLTEAVQAILNALNDLAIPHMVVGSFSSNVYGVSRSTKDIDIVVQLKEQSVRALANRLGPKFVLDPQRGFETVTATHRYVMQIPELTFDVEVFLLSDDEHDQERFARRLPFVYEGCNTSLPTAEDVIITKLRWAATRNKDRDDIANVIAVSGPTLDWQYIQRWADIHGTSKLLSDIQQSIPPE